MSSEIIFNIEESQDGGYIASALGYSIHTEAEDLISLKANIKEAVLCHFDSTEMPKIIRLHIVKDELMAV